MQIKKRSVSTFKKEQATNLGIFNKVKAKIEKSQVGIQKLIGENQTKIDKMNAENEELVAMSTENIRLTSNIKKLTTSELAVVENESPTESPTDEVVD